MLLQITGIFFGFYKNPYFVNTERLVQTILPLASIIICSEIIRFVFLAQKNKAVSGISYLICVLTEVLMVSNVAEITSLNRFMDLVGLTFFPAITANIYYHYSSKRFGMFPNITFRLITTLYVYFMKSVTAMSDTLLSCVKMIFPILLLAFISALYEKRKKNALQRGRKASLVGVILAAAVIASVAMLISCQFRFGAIVIATESMTGEINKGDMIIYERYDDQVIKEGQIIVFLQNQSKIVHRVAKIESIGGETRYYTKGDANESLDSGYITDKDIVGLTDMKVAYIGYPTLWLRELLESSN
ncbi:MAG: signal peptidase I [Clostridia bacterium]|nr:signal peptidase I [Clostridia bacterium]